MLVFCKIGYIICNKRNFILLLLSILYININFYLYIVVLYVSRKVTKNNDRNILVLECNTDQGWDPPSVDGNSLCRLLLRIYPSDAGQFSPSDWSPEARAMNSAAVSGKSLSLPGISTISPSVFRFIK